jgi:hypothetical protein
MPLWMLAAACEPYAPVLGEPGFALGGRHAELPCEQCHLQAPYSVFVARVPCDETVSVVDDPCADCHECDRPAGHYVPQSCADGAGCHAHDDDGWGGAIATTAVGDSCARGCHGPARPDAAPLGDAHARHLDPGSLWTAALACDDCHPQGGGFAPTHDDGKIDVAMSTALAAGPEGAVTPSYAAGSCETWCHGTGLAVPAEAPGWGDGPAAVACGGPCHGWPPGGTHTPVEGCGLCHLPTGGDGQVLADPATHIDGVVQQP